MPTYIIYDKATGQIAHVHREYYMDSEKTLELDEGAMLKELTEILPSGIELGVIACEKEPEPVRGYRYYVDLNTDRLMMTETPHASE